MIKRYSQEYLEEMMYTLDILCNEDKIHAFPREYKDKDIYKEQYLGSEHYAVFIALKGERISGFVIGHEERPHVYKMKLVFVPQFFRFEHIGSSLVRQIAEHAKEEKYHSIESRVARHNVESIKLHESVGWEKYPDPKSKRFYRFAKQL